MVTDRDGETWRHRETEKERERTDRTRERERERVMKFSVAAFVAASASVVASTI